MSHGKDRVLKNEIHSYKKSLKTLTSQKVAK